MAKRAEYPTNGDHRPTAITDRRRSLYYACQCRVPDRQRRVIWSETDPTTRNPDRQRSRGVPSSRPTATRLHYCCIDQQLLYCRGRDRRRSPHRCNMKEESNVWLLHHLPYFSHFYYRSCRVRPGYTGSFPTGVRSLELLDPVPTSRTQYILCS